MIYTFQGFDPRELNAVLEIIKSKDEGISILPEEFIDSRVTDTIPLRELTKTDKTTIISGVRESHYSQKIKAHFFAYGEEEPVYNGARYTFPDGENKWITKVRVCSEIFEPFDENLPFQLLAHPSSLSIESLMCYREMGLIEKVNLESMGLEGVTIASSSHQNSRIISKNKNVGCFRQYSGNKGFIEYDLNSH